MNRFENLIHDGDTKEAVESAIRDGSGGLATLYFPNLTQRDLEDMHDIIEASLSKALDTTVLVDK